MSVLFFSFFLEEWLTWWDSRRRIWEGKSTFCKLQLLEGLCLFRKRVWKRKGGVGCVNELNDSSYADLEMCPHHDFWTGVWCLCCNCSADFAIRELWGPSRFHSNFLCMKIVQNLLLKVTYRCQTEVICLRIFEKPALFVVQSDYPLLFFCDICVWKRSVNSLRQMPWKFLKSLNVILNFNRNRLQLDRNYSHFVINTLLKNQKKKPWSKWPPLLHLPLQFKLQKLIIFSPARPLIPHSSSQSLEATVTTFHALMELKVLNNFSENFIQFAFTNCEKTWQFSLWLQIFQGFQGGSNSLMSPLP